MRRSTAIGYDAAMHASRLAKLLVRSRLVRGGHAHIVDVTNDSRSVKPGWLYAALPGEHVDGHRFIPEAIAAGATGILCERLPSDLASDVAWFVTDDPRVALSELSDAVFGHPSRDIAVIGVTGTDGKTSTVSFVYQLLRELGYPAGYVSSAAITIGGAEQSNPEHQSTPEAPEVHRTLRTMTDAGDRYAVLESTSHGLSMKTARLAHVRYAASVLTNMAHEHLEFHGTFEQYRFDKANLFRALGTGRPLADIVGGIAVGPDSGAPPQPPAQQHPPTPSPELPFNEPFGVLNADDPVYDYFRSATRAPTLSYSVAAGAAAADVHAANFYATDVDPSPASTSFVLHTPIGSSRCTLPIPGPFNVANVLAASAVVAGLCTVRVEDLSDAIGRLRPVRGRMNVVLTAPFSVVVDFAHTPGSFDAVLPFFRAHTPGRLIVVFGSAGERDPGKRPMQGAIADRFADLIVLADEDPRGEDAAAILLDIAAGCPARTVDRDLWLINDRRAAIAHAFALAGTGDTVLLLGKGHETSIIGPDGPQPWDEISVAGELLAASGHQPVR